ncbi:MAG: sigma factor-like helix-turn-helix DNA-binding protein [Candidatus Moranbacteria bacterium]|nr:sigma factor-like helix-turn-helix DNA-binding protein [Candidatus Moranbacteria bacterium]
MKKNLDNLANSVLKEAGEKAGRVFVLRFGLRGNTPQSLGKIGKKMGITRERVRQIEADNFKKMKKLEKSAEFKELESRAVKILDKKGGFCEKMMLKKELIKDPSELEINQLMFLLNCSDRLEYKRETLKTKGFWSKAGEVKQKDITELCGVLEEVIKKERRPLVLKEISGKINRSKRFKKFLENKRAEKALEMLLNLNKKLKRNLLGEWGISRWSCVMERGNRERAYLVLRKKNEPLHYRNISYHINLFWKDKKSLPQTVHNELIKDERFVLVGRGVYGLKEWGFKKGTVKEVIIDILKSQSGPLYGTEIVECVLEQRQVKKMTVMVNLADQNLFEKLSKGRYTLKKR